MARGGSRDSRETFLLDSLRLRVKPTVPKAPQENAVEFYHRDGAFYWLDSSGVEHSFVTSTTVGGSGLEIQSNLATVLLSAAKLNFAPGFIVTNPSAGLATVSLDSEVTQDLVASMLQDSADLDFTYNDGAGTISALLTASGVTAGTYGGNNQVITIAVAASGRVTSLSSSVLQSIRLGAVGASNANFNIEKARVQTTNATATTIIAFATATGSSYLVKWMTAARRTDISGSAAGFERIFRVKNIGGVITVGSVQSSYTDRDVGVNVSVTTSGTNVLLQVSGIGSQSWDWNAAIEWLEV